MASALPQPVQRLINELARLPGIGPKTASRLAFYLLRTSDNLGQDLADALDLLDTNPLPASLEVRLTEGSRDPDSIAALAAGLVLLVGLFERQVVILTDKGIDARLPSGAFQTVIDAMTPLLRQGDRFQALMQGVAHTQYRLKGVTWPPVMAIVSIVVAVLIVLSRTFVRLG